MRHPWRPVGAAAACVLVTGALGVPAGATQPSPSSSAPGAASSGAPTPASGPSPVTSSDDVEVTTYGTVTVRPAQSARNEPILLAVHGVQRVEGATVVYYSAGYPESTEEVGDLTYEITLGTGYLASGYIGPVRVVDTVGNYLYRTVARPGSEGRGEPFATARDDMLPPEPGSLGVGYAVLPELPESVTTVDVDLVFGQTVPDVPVGEGYLEPAVRGDDVVPLGSGWPQVDEDAVAAVANPEQFVFPLTSQVVSLDGAQTVNEAGDAVTIDLASDVLFAFDSADLTAEAQARLADVAARLTADGATGEVGIVGHTSSEGADAYNLDLSQRRAQSVSAVLQPALAGLPVTFAVEGRGEAEPVASNADEAGRAQNRRVTISYTAGG